MDHNLNPLLDEMMEREQHTKKKKSVFHIPRAQQVVLYSRSSVDKV